VTFRNMLVINELSPCPRRESNPDLRFRKPPFYPLNYGDCWLTCDDERLKAEQNLCFIRLFYCRQ
jgi:hypothetical protein